MKKYEYIATGGESGFTDPLLIGKTILSIEIDGIGITKISGSAPASNQAQYLNYTGTINFYSALAAGQFIKVLYQDNGNVCFPVDIPSSFTLPDSNAGFGYNASFFIIGTGSSTMSAVVKPLWMTITISGGKVIFTGTPAISDAGIQTVSFTLTNACGSVNFSQSFTVTALTAQFQPGTYVGGDRSKVTETANLFGTPGVKITVTLDNLINTNGGTLTVNGIAATLNETWIVTLDAKGTGTMNLEIVGMATNYGTTILGHFTMTSVSAGSIGTTKTFQISKAF